MQCFVCFYCRSHLAWGFVWFRRLLPSYAEVTTTAFFMTLFQLKRTGFFNVETPRVVVLTDTQQELQTQAIVPVEELYCNAAGTLTHRRRGIRWIHIIRAEEALSRRAITNYARRYIQSLSERSSRWVGMFDDSNDFDDIVAAPGDVESMEGSIDSSMVSSESYDSLPDLLPVNHFDDIDEREDSDSDATQPLEDVLLQAEMDHQDSSRPRWNSFTSLSNYPPAILRRAASMTIIQELSGAASEEEESAYEHYAYEEVD